MLAVLWSQSHAHEAAWIWAEDGHEYGIEAIGSLNGVKLMEFAQMRVDLVV